jgi:hypothetical protein
MIAGVAGGRGIGFANGGPDGSRPGQASGFLGKFEAERRQATDRACARSAIRSSASSMPTE